MKIIPFIFSALLIFLLMITSYPQTTQNLKEAQAQYQKGHKKLYSSDFKGAAEDMTKAIGLNPKNEVLEKVDGYEFRNEIAYGLRALVKLQLKDYKSALADCDMAMKLDPKYSYAYYVRGQIKKAISDYKGSIEDFSKTIELAPKNNWAYYDRGLVKQSLKDYKGAIQDYDEAIELVNRMGVAYYQRGIAKTELGDNEGASADMDSAAKYGVKEAKNPLREIENSIKNYKK